MAVQVYRDPAIFFPGDIWINSILPRLNNGDLAQICEVCKRLRSIIKLNGEFLQKALFGKTQSLRSRVDSLNFSKIEDLIDFEFYSHPFNDYRQARAKGKEISTQLKTLRTTISQLPKNPQGGGVMHQNQAVDVIFLEARNLSKRVLELETCLSKLYITAKKEDTIDKIKLLFVGLVVIPMMVYMVYCMGQRHRMQYGL